MARTKDPAVQSLDQALKGKTREGVLYEPMEGGKLRCFSCGHRCVILDGLDGICRVRFNRGGKLFVPRGYVGGLQVDPIEKKPFFHAFPGAVALSFGMLGCDYHCGYCFTPNTRVLTSRGHLRIDELYAACAAGRRDALPEAIPGPPGLAASTHAGRSRAVAQVFRHHYSGKLVRIQPACLPAIEATPEHPFLVARPPTAVPCAAPELAWIPAKDLSRGDLLVVPNDHELSENVMVRTAEHLMPHASAFRTPRKIGKPALSRIQQLSRAGRTSREIGRTLGLDASHVRHLRSKLARGAWRLDSLDHTPMRLVESEGRVRFSKEHAPGITAEIPLDERFAWLLGLYCAEGSISRAKGRVNSATLVLSLGHHEEELAERAERTLSGVLGVRARRVHRATTLGIEVGKASAALLFESLCGTGARNKRAPQELFRAHRPIVEAFVEGYVEGDGYRAPNGTITISTVSRELAAGVAGLLLRLGILPQWYEYEQGRQIEQSPQVHVVRWHPERRCPTNVAAFPGFFLVPIREITTPDYDGPVYNLETAEEHSYLANGIAVHNCQNWLTSQALRDSAALAPPQEIEPEEIVAIAKARSAPVMVSTYNEPLITSEWAVEVFSQAKEAGITCGYVSNGNGTPEVLRYIRPYVDLYKVDLKGFRDASYRELGGKLQNVLDTIRSLHLMGFWLEIVTLLIPGFNDSTDEIRELTSFVASVSPDIPWHVTAFHQDYKMLDKSNTTARDLMRAASIGKESGLRYVYAGNLPGLVGDLENTHCHACGELLIERFGYRVLQYRVSGEGTCPACRVTIPGFWRAGWRIPESDGGLRGRRPEVVWIKGVKS